MSNATVDPVKLFAKALPLSLALGFVFGCGGGLDEAHSPGGNGGPKNAAEMATNLIGGQVNAYVWVSKAKGNPVGPKLLSTPFVAGLLDGTGLDPLRDIDRVFVTAQSATSQRAILFAEHNLDKEGTHRAILSVIQKSNPPGQLVPMEGAEAAHANLKGRSGLVAFVPPRYLVVVPDDLADKVTSFSASGGLADPAGEEVAKGTALNPHVTLVAPHAPEFPPTMSQITSTVFLKPDGGMLVDIVGESPSPEQAVADAQFFTASVEKATTVHMSIITMRAMDPIPFHSEGNEVKGKANLSREDVERLISLAEAFIQQN